MRACRPNLFRLGREGIGAWLSLYVAMYLKVSTPIKVLLVEPHQMWREELARLIAESPGFHLAASTGTGTEAVRLCRESAPDVVVMAAELEDGDAMQVTAEILGVSPPTEVVLMQRSSDEDESVAIRAIQSGALGLVSTRAPASGLVKAIHTVAQGRPYLGSIPLAAVAKRLASMSAGD